MNDLDEVYAEFSQLSEELLRRVDGVSELWFRPESESVVDIRLALEDDNWAARERAIASITALRREVLEDVSINYSFTLPDAAYRQESERAVSVRADSRIKALV